MLTNKLSRLKKEGIKFTNCLHNNTVTSYHFSRVRQCRHVRGKVPRSSGTA
jgi:hypothetical protein